jgi:hypothetical protein
MTRATLMIATLTVLGAAVARPAVSAASGQHGQHAAGQKHGDAPMGFDAKKTVHHFQLAEKGGSIEVSVKDPADVELRDRVQTHLRSIATQFGEGNFATPFAVHNENPAGVSALKQHAAEITYTFEPSNLGGRVAIVTQSREALAAVHAFLRYQIREHKTGDPLTVRRQ